MLQCNKLVRKVFCLHCPSTAALVQHHIVLSWCQLPILRPCPCFVDSDRVTLNGTAACVIRRGAQPDPQLWADGTCARVTGATCVDAYPSVELWGGCGEGDIKALHLPSYVRVVA